MTNLASLFDWLAAGKAIGNTEGQTRNASDFRLRSLPKEEIHVFVKAIDNSKVVRLVDKKDWLASAGMAGGVMVASLLLIALLLPGGYNLLAGHRMEQLKSERARLNNELKVLRAREASILSPKNLQMWGGQKFVTPTAASVVFAPPTQGTVAALSNR